MLKVVKSHPIEEIAEESAVPLLERSDNVDHDTDWHQFAQECLREANAPEAYQLDEESLNETDGVTVQDNLDVNVYPMPMYANGKDDVFVGRIRRATSQPNSLNLWVVSDNLRKGAATNTIQIAEYLTKNNLV